MRSLPLRVFPVPAVALLLVALGLLITSCAGLPTYTATASRGAGEIGRVMPQASDTLVLWHAFQGRELAALEFVLATWNQDASRPRLHAIAFDGAGFTERLSDAVRAGTGPDLVIWAHDKTAEWSERGIIVPIDAALASNPGAPVRDRFLPTCLGALTWQGRLHGLPLAFETLIMYTNRDLVPTPPRTTDELIRAAKRVTNRSRDRWGLVYERGNFYHHAMWLHGFGGRVFDDSGRLALRSPESIRSLTFARDLASRHRVVPDTVDWRRQMELFNSGRAGILIGGPWVYGSIDQSRVNLAISPLPLISGLNRHPSPFLGVKGLFVTANCRDTRAAVAALDHLTSPFCASMLNVMAGSLPADRLAYDYSIVAADFVTSSFKEQVRRATCMPSHPDMHAVWEVMMTDPATMRPGALDRVFLYGVDPAVALADAEAEFHRRTAR